MSIDEKDRLGVGGNNPPPQTLLERLSEEHAQLRHDVEKLADRANGGPRKIESAEDLEEVSQLVLDARALFKKLDGTRTSEKEPFLQGGRDVDTFFKQFTDRVKRINDVYQGVADAYQAARAAKARQKAEEEARLAREEAQRAAAAAAQAQADNRASQAQEHAAKANDATVDAAIADQRAKASVADLTRTRTESGNLATGKSEWSHEITDYNMIDLNALRMNFKRDDVEKAIRQAVKNGLRELPGVRIFDTVKAQIRKS